MASVTRRGAVAGLGAVLAVPLLVAVVALRRPTWFPVLDLAMTELRVRDVFGADTPLVGLPGRIGTIEEQGSHPGPLSFYLLAPTYRLLGSSAWALQVATVVLQVAAVVTALVLAVRIGRVRLALAVGAVIAVLEVSLGLSVATEPWNPYLPVAWWLVFLLALWAAMGGDHPMIVVAVAAGSLCAQTHVPYLGLALGLGVVALAVAAVEVWRAPARPARLRRLGGWVGAGLGLGLLLWAPVVVDQLANDPGNVRILVEHLGDPPEEPVGLGTGVRAMLAHLDPTALIHPDGATGALVRTSYDDLGVSLPGLAVAACWAVAVAAAVWLRHRQLLHLHILVAAGLLLGALNVSRVFGKLWYYLMLWGWVLAGLLALAVCWTALEVARRARPNVDRTALRVATVGLVIAVVAPTAVLSAAAVSIDPPAPALSAPLGEVVGPTEAALREGVGAANGADGRYVVIWADAVHIGSQGYGLVSELERRGLDVGVRSWARAPVTEHRVIPDAEVTAVVVLVAGTFIDEWRARPDVDEVADADTRTGTQVAEYERLRTAVQAELRRRSLDDLAGLVDTNLFGASLDPRLPSSARDGIERMIEIGGPIAVFLAPPDEGLG
jgi:hypothetical protein